MSEEFPPPGSIKWLPPLRRVNLDENPLEPPRRGKLFTHAVLPKQALPTEYRSHHQVAAVNPDESAVRHVLQQSAV